MKPIKVLDLFSGIGGFALAGQMVGGFETVAFCEIDPFAQKVLKKNFPNIPIFSDVRTLTIESLRDAGITQIDCITGGFPCVDISVANPNGRGLEGERSGLFYELVRIVRQCRPHYLVLENVSNILAQREGRTMGVVFWEFSQSGYAVEWQIISAASLGAPHLRERIYFVAHSNLDGRRSRQNNRQRRHIQTNQKWNFEATQQNWEQRESRIGSISAIDASTASHSDSKGLQGSRQKHKLSESQGERQASWSGWGTIEPTICRNDDGISSRLDSHRIRVLGNAVVPQCAAIALERVKQLHQQLNN